MTKYDSMQDLSDKADWEGGWAVFITSYGLNPGDLPDDAPELLEAELVAFQAAWDALEKRLEPWL